MKREEEIEPKFKKIEFTFVDASKVKFSIDSLNFISIPSIVDYFAFDNGIIDKYLASPKWFSITLALKKSCISYSLRDKLKQILISDIILVTTDSIWRYENIIKDKTIYEVYETEDNLLIYIGSHSIFNDYENIWKKFIHSESIMDYKILL